MPRPARAARPAGAPAWPRRGIERPRGTFVSGNAAATLGALSPSRAALSFVFGLLEAWGCPRLRASWGVPLRRRRLRGREGLHAGPENQVKQEGAFSAGRVGWGGAGSRGGGVEHLGRAARGDASMQPVLLAKASKKAKRRALKPLFTALGVGPALPRLPSAALIADCVSPAQERRAGAAGTAQASRPQHSVNLERGADAPSTPAPRRQQQPNQKRHPLRNHGGAPPRRER